MRLVRPVFALMVAIAASGGGVVLAQSAPPLPPSPAEPTTAQALGLDTPIETLVATPAAKAVLDADIPGLTDHPMYGQFKRETLRSLAPKFGGAISDGDLAKVQAHLAALPKTMASR
jgi:hypothetical protein